MKIAFLDCSSGISGDMCLGALVDAGAPLTEIERELRRLPVRGYKLELRRVKRASVAAAKIDVRIQRKKVPDRRAEARSWDDVRAIIDKSALPSPIKEKGLKVFRRLFESEGKVHGKAFNKTHLHELGAVDCAVDIFGTLIGLDLLGIQRVYSSPVNVGSGFVITEHGRLPVPAPATAEILKGVPVYSSDAHFELTTPTGAAILREIAGDFGGMPPMIIKTIGYGAGEKDVPHSSNTLRIILGEDVPEGDRENSGKITVIETNIDDMNPQLYEHVIERLFGAGALDVYLTQVIMKKGRPGVVLTALCRDGIRMALIDILLKETTTIGVRFHEVSRAELDREIKKVGTEFGELRVKMSKITCGEVKFTPEYEDCKKISRKTGMPLIEVMKKVQRQAR